MRLPLIIGVVRLILHWRVEPDKVLLARNKSCSTGRRERRPVALHGG